MIAAFFFLLSLIFFNDIADAQTASVRKWEVYEIALTSSTSYDNPYTEIEITADFTGPDGITKTVKGFWDGGNDYILRFTPTIEGTWTYSITNNAGDSGLEAANQTLTVTAADSNSKGFLRADDRYPTKFIFDNGEYYFMLGTTAYEYMANARDNTVRWEDTVNFYKSKGINKVRFYVFPANYPYYCRFTSSNTAMQYEDTRPFTGSIDTIDHNSLNIEHWQLLDQMVEYMASKEMIADLIMLNDPCYGRAFSTASPDNPATEDIRYMKYIVSRYAAYPNVIWCITNEYQLDGGLPNGLDKTTGSSWNSFWNLMGTVTMSEDPWREDAGKRRALSIHGKFMEFFPDETGRFISQNDIPYIWFDPDFASQDWPTFAISEWDIHMTHESSSSCYTSGFQTSCWNAPGAESIPDWEGQRGVIKVVKDQNLPIVDDEFKYIYDAPGEDDYHRRAIWGTYVAGGYFSIGDAIRDSGGSGWGFAHFSTGNYVNSGIMQNVFNQLNHLNTFFKKVQYWKMNSHNELVPQYAKIPWDDNNRVYTLADPGDEYVVYDAVGTSFSINLAAGTDYDVYRFDPRDGTEESLGIYSGGSQTFDSPPGDDWAYRIVAAVNIYPQCSDGIDNDGDGLIDYPADPGCGSAADDDEFNVISESCTMTYAYWGQSMVNEGDLVQLTVEGSDGCNGEIIGFNVFEDDSDRPGNADDPADTNPGSAIFYNGTATSQWIAEMEPDCGGTCLPAEYYFIAELISDAGNSIDSKSSGFLYVTDDPLGMPGDCNGDDLIDAGDISALTLEIFDGDGNLPADAPGGTFPGDPLGSDANGDGIVDAGDLSCLFLLILNGPGACG